MTVMFLLDWHPAGDSAGSSASSTAAAAAATEGGLCSNRPTSTRNQDPVFYHIPRPDSETHGSPTNPGTLSLTT